MCRCVNRISHGLKSDSMGATIKCVKACALINKSHPKAPIFTPYFHNLSEDDGTSAEFSHKILVAQLIEDDTRSRHMHDYKYKTLWRFLKNVSNHLSSETCYSLSLVLCFSVINAEQLL